MRSKTHRFKVRIDECQDNSNTTKKTPSSRRSHPSPFHHNSLWALAKRRWMVKLVICALACIMHTVLSCEFFKHPSIHQQVGGRFNHGCRKKTSAGSRHQWCFEYLLRKFPWKYGTSWSIFLLASKSKRPKWPSKLPTFPKAFPPCRHRSIQLANTNGGLSGHGAKVKHVKAAWFCPTWSAEGFEHYGSWMMDDGW